MTWSLLQAVVSNTPSQTGSTGGVLTASATLAACTPGSFLVICSVEQSTGDTPTTSNLTITGIGSWNTRGSWGNAQSSGSIWKGRGVFSFIKNAGTFSGAVTVAYTFPSGGLSRTDKVQFVIMEFLGVTSSVSYLDGGGLNLGNAGIPDPGSLFSSADNELVVVGYTGNSGSSGLPSGFSSPGSLSGLAFAGVAYKLNCLSSQTAAWSSGSQLKWGAGAHSVFGQAVTESVTSSLTFF
jgi:hypothetical protein